ncbi:MAG: dihydropteroate synthase [Ornithinimicrobium sp.]
MTSVMGVLNVTPDSFSDGGRWQAAAQAVARGLDLARQGADIVDVGGESTRPGARRPSEDEELGRVVPVVEGLYARGLTVSVDTMRASVAEAALQAGASMVNDVSGGLADPAMTEVVARAGVPFIAMHWRGHSAEMDAAAHYRDVVAEVVEHLGERVDQLRAGGLSTEQIILDPGFGFAKDAAHNWTLLAGLSRVVDLGHPVLVGTSRKRFLGQLPRVPVELAPAERDTATAATSLLCAQAGVWAVRVHDVPSTTQALGVWERVQCG